MVNIIKICESSDCEIKKNNSMNYIIFREGVENYKLQINNKLPHLLTKDVGDLKIEIHNLKEEGGKFILYNNLGEEILIVLDKTRIPNNVMNLLNSKKNLSGNLNSSRNLGKSSKVTSKATSKPSSSKKNYYPT